MSTVNGLIESLTIYPVKSCRPIPLQQAKLTPFGLEGDRQWMIVDENGGMITQRKYPQLTQLAPEITPEGLVLKSIDSGSQVLLSADESSTKSVSIWKDKVEALLAPKSVTNWLNHHVKTDKNLTLVKFNSRTMREPGQSLRFGASGKHFADAAPYLITNVASLRALNDSIKDQVDTDIPMESFRANIVVSGPDAFAEHRLHHIALSEESARLELIDHCQRCAMITLDPWTGERRAGALPFKQLADLNPMPDNAKAPAFGVNARLANSALGVSSISVGDPITWR